MSQEKNGLIVPTKKTQTVERFVHPHAIPTGIIIWGERKKTTIITDDSFISPEAVAAHMATVENRCTPSQGNKKTK